MNFWFFVFLIIAVSLGVYIGSNPKKAFRIMVPLTVEIIKFIFLWTAVIVMFGVGFWFYNFLNLHIMPEYPIMDTVMSFLFGISFGIYTLLGLGMWMTRNDSNRE